MFNNIPILVTQFETHPDAEALGIMMSAWLDNQLADETRPRLAKKGIESLDYEAYYPFQIFLDTMREIVQENRNVTMQLVAIGKAVVEHMQIDDFDTMEDF
ncbi:MAG: hypothetical protein AAF653_18610, partial [Chloroflexota bacterium]